LESKEFVINMEDYAQLEEFYIYPCETIGGSEELAAEKKILEDWIKNHP
jgi:hypothetical protein